LNALCGIYAASSSSNTFANNSCSSNVKSGLGAWGSDNNIISNNTFQDNGEGISFLTGSDSATVQGNTISGNVVGIRLEGSSQECVAHHNNIFGNTGYGVDTRENEEEPVDASENWWGDVSGPSHSSNPGGEGDRITDHVEYDPWLEEPVGTPENRPPSVMLSSPANGARVLTDSPVLSWEGKDDDGGPLSYDVHLDTDPEPGERVSEGQGEKSYTASGLAEGETYYWKVVVSDGEFEVESEIWQFTVNTPPTIEPGSPANGAVATSSSPVLSWSGDDDDGDPLSYDVYLDTNSGPETLVSEGQGEESYTPSELVEGETYYWKVVVSDGHEELGSEVWQFTVNTPPTIELTSPASGSVVPSSSPVLSWQSDDVDGGPLSYDVYLDTDPGPGTTVSEGQTAETLAPSGLADGETYYWKVVVSDGHVEVGSEVWQFTVNTPPTIELTSPASGSVEPSSSPVLSWLGEDDDDPLSYDVYLDTDPEPESMISEEQTGESYISSGLVEGEIYYWKVVVSDGYVELESEVWSFEIEMSTPSNEAPTITISRPDDGEKIGGIYDIQGTASDDEEVTEVEIAIDGGEWLLVSRTGSWSYSWDTTSVGNGEHEIRGRAFDGEKHSEIVVLVVVVENEKDGSDGGGFLPGFEIAIISIILVSCACAFRKKRW